MNSFETAMPDDMGPDKPRPPVDLGELVDLNMERLKRGGRPGIDRTRKDVAAMEVNQLATDFMAERGQIFSIVEFQSAANKLWKEIREEIAACRSQKKPEKVRLVQRGALDRIENLMDRIRSADDGVIADAEAKKREILLDIEQL